MTSYHVSTRLGWYPIQHYLDPSLAAHEDITDNAGAQIPVIVEPPMLGCRCCDVDAWNFTNVLIWWREA